MLTTIDNETIQKEVRKVAQSLKKLSPMSLAMVSASIHTLLAKQEMDNHTKPPGKIA